MLHDMTIPIHVILYSLLICIVGFITPVTNFTYKMYTLNHKNIRLAANFFK